MLVEIDNKFRELDTGRYVYDSCNAYKYFNVCYFAEKVKAEIKDVAESFILIDEELKFKKDNPRKERCHINLTGNSGKVELSFVQGCSHVARVKDIQMYAFMPGYIHKFLKWLDKKGYRTRSRVEIISLDRKEYYSYLIESPIPITERPQHFIALRGYHFNKFKADMLMSEFTKLLYDIYDEYGVNNFIFLSNDFRAEYKCENKMFLKYLLEWLNDY